MASSAPTAYVALLRGINVGGNRSVKMAHLRSILADAGCADVTTYIQSGNAVFRHVKGAGLLNDELEAAIADAVGFDVPVVLRTAKEWAKVARANPFGLDPVEPTQLHVGFLRDKPAKGSIGGVDVSGCAPEEVVLTGRELYYHLPNGMGRAKLPFAALERAVGTVVTARNWNTVLKLDALVADLAD